MLVDQRDLEFEHPHRCRGPLHAALLLADEVGPRTAPLHDEGQRLAVRELLVLLRLQRHELRVVPARPPGLPPVRRLRDALHGRHGLRFLPVPRVLARLRLGEPSFPRPQRHGLRLGQFPDLLAYVLDGRAHVLFRRLQAPRDGCDALPLANGVRSVAEQPLRLQGLGEARGQPATVHTPPERLAVDAQFLG